MEVSLKSLPGSIFGTGGLGLNQWNRKVYSINMLNSGLICTREFSFFKNKSRNISLRHTAFGRIHEESRKHFFKCLFVTKCKLPPSKKSASAMSVCYSTALPSPFYLPSLKSYPFIEKYFLPSLPYHQDSISLLQICHEKCSQSLKRPKSLKSLTSSKCLKHPKYLLKWKLPLLQFCKQYSSSSPASCPYSFSQKLPKNIQEAPKSLSESQRNKTRKTSVYRGPCYPIFLRRVHRRGFHSSLFPLAKSDSNKPSDCTKMDKICKPTKVKTEDKCGKQYKEKSDVCYQEKVKCDKSQLNKARQKPKMEKKIVDPACRKTCLPIGKCELPHTIPPSKMEYAKVTCSPPKFAKPEPCPPMLEYFQKDDKFHIETKQINARKKQICTPPPLPKPPFAPIVLCPCSPPRKLHPGPCPCYAMKQAANNKRPSVKPCPLKEKYPCPTGVHYCPLQKKPCNLKQETRCDHKKKKEAPAS